MDGCIRWDGYLFLCKYSFSVWVFVLMSPPTMPWRTRKAGDPTCYHNHLIAIVTMDYIYQLAVELRSELRSTLLLQPTWRKRPVPSGDVL